MRLAVPERIVSSRLVLTRFGYEDAEEIFYTYASKPEATKFVSWPTHQKLSDTHQFLKNAASGWSSGTDYSFSVRKKSNHRLAGSVGIINDIGNLQFGYIFGPLFWGQGFATETCIALLTEVRSLPGVLRIGTFIDAENVASGKVLLKAGLVAEARHSKWFRFVNQNNEAKDCILFRLPF